jgi:hypothetical protein
LIFSQDVLQANNGNLLPWPTAQSLQRAICRDASTKHWSSKLVGKIVWDLERKVLVHADVTREAALGNRSIWVFRTVSIHLLRTVILLILLASAASQVSPDLSADADPIANFDIFDGIANADGMADDFVTDAQRDGVVAPTTRYLVNIAGANAAGGDCDIDIAVFEFLELELRTRCCQLLVGSMDGGLILLVW